MSGTCGFEQIELEPVVGLRRLLGRKPAENVYREIQNLLAITPVSQIGPTAVTDVLAEYKLPLAEAKPRLVAFYGTALRYFARDLELSPSELDDLRHLRNVLGLNDSDVRVAATGAYRAALKTATADSHLSEDEKARLTALETQLRLPDETVREIRTEEIDDVVKRALAAAVADRRLSPAEESQLDALKKNLGATVTLDATGVAALDHYRLLWRLDQNELPVTPAPILLKRGETCHFILAASHHQPRADRGLKFLDEGTLYVTNKRVLFDGASKSVSISLSKIIAFRPFADALMVQKDSGKDQYFKTFEADSARIEILAGVLGAVLRLDRAPAAKQNFDTLDLAPAPGRGA